MPAWALPGSRISPRDSSTSASGAVNVRNGTCSALACAGVSLRSQPATMNVRSPIPPTAGPTNARRETGGNRDDGALNCGLLPAAIDTDDGRWMLSANSALDQWGAHRGHGKLVRLN